MSESSPPPPPPPPSPSADSGRRFGRSSKGKDPESRPRRDTDLRTGPQPGSKGQPDGRSGRPAMPKWSAWVL
ncbi:MAG: hypothetical protein ACKOYO_06495, partial [Actinomycetota bacterium]